MSSTQAKKTPSAKKGQTMKNKKAKPGKKKDPNQSSSTEHEIVTQMYRDMQWFNEHKKELVSQYGHGVIAVHHEQVVGSGADDNDVRRQAVDTGHPSDEILLFDILPVTRDFSPDFV